MNPTVGDIDGNSRKIREYLDRGVDEGAQLVVFPELAINGYPPEDLLLKTHFLAAGRRALDEISPSTCATPSRWSASPSTPRTSSTPSRCSPTARSAGIYRKMFLPNYGVFDEHRYFQVGDTPAIARLNGTTARASRSARTSGSRARPPATWRWPAPR